MRLNALEDFLVTSIGAAALVKHTPAMINKQPQGDKLPATVRAIYQDSANKWQLLINSATLLEQQPEVRRIL